MWNKFRLYLEMIRFSHTLFALPFALFSAIMAWYLNAHEEPPVAWQLQELLGILLCMVLARSSAMAFNRLADWRFDADNPRTRARHIPSGLLSAASVRTFALLSALGFIASTLLFFPNRWPLYLSVPVLLFLLGYSLAKRFTALAHYWLGAALMLAPLAAWIALRGELAWPPVVLGLAVMFWVGGFDIIYACQDYEFDRQAGLRSIPARVGVPTALRFAALSHAVMLVCLLLLPLVFSPLGGIYGVGIAAVTVLLGYEHWLVRPDDLTRVNTAFFHVNAVVSLGLLLVGALDLWF